MKIRKGSKRHGVAVAAALVGMFLLTPSAGAHGTCKDNHSYQTTDGTHDSDGDGIGCEDLPPRPSSSPPPSPAPAPAPPPPPPAPAAVGGAAAGSGTGV